VDKAVHNPSRIARIPGTWNRKGPDTPERPHRLATLISVPDPWEPFKLVAVTPEPAEPAETVPQVRPERQQPDSPLWPPMLVRVQRCRTFVAEIPGAISGDRGHDKTLRIARVIANDFAIDRANGYPILQEYNARCRPPWSPRELERKWAAGSQTSSRYPRGRKLGEPKDWNDPHRLARLYSRTNRVKYHQEAYYTYTGTHYQEIPKHDLKAKVSLFVEGECDKQQLKLKRTYDRQWQARVDAGENPRYQMPQCPKVTVQLVSNVVSALESVSLIPGTFAPPCWLPDGKKTPSVAFVNGILDLDTRVLIPHSPQWFSPVCLPYPYLLQGQCPTWLRVLNDCLPEPGKQRLLQQWFGLMLSSVNTQQCLILHGNGSNGKSVILTVMGAFLGRENISTVALENFGKPFALAQTLGKLANICPETTKLDQQHEGILKAFVSQDPMQFERKFRDPFTSRPTARLVVATNQFPSWIDKSDGLARRMVPLYFGVHIPDEKKDRRLTEEGFWTPELPGIFLWALEGVKQLAANRWNLDIPAESRRFLYAHKLDCNPARKFLKERYVHDPGGRVQTGDVYREYRNWCVDHGYSYPLPESPFGKEVSQEFPTVTRTKQRSGGKLVNVYVGIRERNEDDPITEPEFIDVERGDNETRNDGAGNLGSPFSGDRPEETGIRGLGNPECGGLEGDWIGEILARSFN
jgi:P4 family phage/plasmid primase-like protien